MLTNHYHDFKNSSDPWNIVEKHSKKVLNSNSEETLMGNYMNEYSSLQKPTAYNLVRFKKKLGCLTFLAIKTTFL